MSSILKFPKRRISIISASIKLLKTKNRVRSSTNVSKALILCPQILAVSFLKVHFNKKICYSNLKTEELQWFLSKIKLIMGATKKFAVVIFNDDNCVSAVPLSWVSEDQRSCQWPVKYPHSFKKLIQDPNSKPEADWISLAIELKKKYSKLKNN